MTGKGIWCMPWFVLSMVFTNTTTAGAQQAPRDTIKPSFPRAAINLALVEVVPFLYDRYGKHADYARVSISSLAHNIQPRSWVWDTDAFPTNQIGHPFHGSQFFNAFRTEGYSFWQSVPAAFAGSYIWETFGENEPPSINDFINTGFGGVMLGELTHRLAEKIHLSQRRGWIKEAGKIAALCFNPIDGLRRIENGTWKKRWPAQATPPLHIEVDFGLRKFSPNHSNPFTDGQFGPYGRLWFSYGKPIADMKTPFSYITLVAEFGQDAISALNILSLRGQVAAWKIPTRREPHLLSISADYDYLCNEVFFYSGESIKLNLHSVWCNKPAFSLSTAVGLGPVILAAIPNDYNYLLRNYDYGPGFAFYGNGNLDIFQRVGLSVRYNGGWMFTSNGSDSRYYLHMVTAELKASVNRRLSLCMESGHFTLFSRYEQSGATQKLYPYLRMSARVLPF